MSEGALILAGGAEFDELMAPADRAWLGLFGAKRPRVAVLPTANERRPDLAAANGAAHFRGLGFDAEALMVTERATANDPRIAGRLAEVDAVYMAGGNPVYLSETLKGSLVWRRLCERWRAGMGVGGSSAGAMVLCGTIFVHDRWAEGLGLLAGAAVLPHFDRRDDAGVEGARRAMTERGLTGIGIDEHTALIWSAGSWRVEGAGRVRLLLPDGVVSYGPGEVALGLEDPE